MIEHMDDPWRELRRGFLVPTLVTAAIVVGAMVLVAQLA